MNLANKLTLSRVVTVPIFMVFLLPDSFWIPQQLHSVSRVIALLLFVAAAITDYWDGVLARRHNWISSFGQLFDPLADKLIVMAAFVGMVELKIFSSWMVILILCREFLITGLRTLAVSQGKILAADRWGKNKTISQMTTIITALVYLSARDIVTQTGHWDEYVVNRWGLEWWLTMALQFMMLFCTALTVLSGWLYMQKNWDMIREDIK